MPPCYIGKLGNHPESVLECPRIFQKDPFAPLAKKRKILLS